MTDARHIRNALPVLLLAAAARAALVCDAPLHDFGARPDTDLGFTHTFTLRNAGDAPLTITAIRTSCDCLAATAGQPTLRPGERVPVDARFDFRDESGPQNRAVHVAYRPAGAPPESPAAVCTLTLRGAILPPVIRLPNRLDLGVVPPGSVATGTLSLVSGRCGPFALNAVALHDTDARAEFTAHQTATNQEVRLLIPAPPSCGPFAGLAVAATDLPEAPTVPIQYGGRVAPYLEARPNVLAPPGDAQPLQARLTVSSPYGQPFRILAAACTDPRISVTTAARSDRHVTVSVTSAPLAPRPDNALVRLTTDHPLCRTLEIPIRTVILR